MLNMIATNCHRLGVDHPIHPDAKIDDGWLHVVFMGGNQTRTDAARAGMWMKGELGTLVLQDITCCTFKALCHSLLLCFYLCPCFFLSFSLSLYAKFTHIVVLMVLVSVLCDVLIKRARW